MKHLWLIAGASAIFAFSSCTSNANKQLESKDSTETELTASSPVDTTHTSQVSVDWQGKYVGVIPCADCPGIETTINLNADDTFTYLGVYQERDTKIEDTGKFMWHDNGSTVHLVGKEVNMKLKVGENQLFSLDQDGKPIDGPLKEHYVLKKVVN